MFGAIGAIQHTGMNLTTVLNRTDSVVDLELPMETGGAVVDVLKTATG
jgi:hypothetical protein